MKTRRLKFTDDCRPKNNALVMLCTQTGKIWCGVVRYPHALDGEWYGEGYLNQIILSMFINDRETEGKIPFENIRWWHLLPLTKKELYSGNAH